MMEKRKHTLFLWRLFSLHELYVAVRGVVENVLFPVANPFLKFTFQRYISRVTSYACLMLLKKLKPRAIGENNLWAPIDFRMYRTHYDFTNVVKLYPYFQLCFNPCLDPLSTIFLLKYFWLQGTYKRVPWKDNFRVNFRTNIFRTTTLRNVRSKIKLNELGRTITGVTILNYRMTV